MINHTNMCQESRCQVNGSFAARDASFSRIVFAPRPLTARLLYLSRPQGLGYEPLV